jgi:predicted aconitase with swiveling domain
MGDLILGRPLVRGHAEGIALVSDEPISFWGGYDQHTGEITDRRHPLSGHTAAGRVLVVPFSRGSSTASAVLLEAARLGTAPAAIITTGTDAFFALASIVAHEMYHLSIPVIAVRADQFARLRTGDRVVIAGDGCIRIRVVQEPAKAVYPPG